MGLPLDYIYSSQDFPYEHASNNGCKSLPAYHISPWLAAAVPNVLDAPVAAMNPGTSINFDANALQTQDEAEFQKEEQQQMEELRELLSNALDNCTEDGLSVSSNDEDEEGELSREGSFKNSKKQRLNGNSSFDHHPILSNTFPGGTMSKPIQNGHLQTDEPLRNTMPGNSARNSDETGQPYNHNPTPQQDPQQQQQPPMYYPQYHYLYPAEENITSSDGHEVNNYDGHNHVMYPGMTGGVHPGMTGGAHPAHPGHHYGVVQGGVLHEAENDQWMTPGSSQGYYQENFMPDHLPAGGGGGVGGSRDYYSQIPNSMSYDGQSFVPGHMQPYQTNGVDLNSHPHLHRSPSDENCPVPTSGEMEISHPQTNGYIRPGESEHPITSNWDQLNGYKVQYRKPAEPLLSPHKKERPHSASSSRESSPQKPEKEFIRIGGGTDQKSIAQLQILYKARGRKLDELTEELTSVKRENAREVCLLQHKVSSAEDECEALKNGLKQCQDFLTEEKSDNTQLMTRMETSEALIQSLSNCKEELLSKLVAAECAVESLNHQLKELGKSETLERARQQHDSIIESLQLRHQREIVLLKEEIDALTKCSNSSNEEIVLLKRQLSDSLKNIDNAHISKAETINRLTRSLEESQRQNQYLLQTSQSPLTNQQMVELQNRLQQSESAKIILKEKCDGLGNEVKMLRQELAMFESASKLGVVGKGENKQSSCDPEDSFEELGIKKKLNFATPDTTINEDSGVDSQLQGLKHQLQQCFTNNRERHVYFDQLTNQLMACQKEAHSWQSKYVKSESVVQELTEKLSRFKRIENGMDGRERGVVLSEKENDNSLESKEEWLESKNKELEEKLKQVSEEHAVDKADSLEQCKKAYETFQDDVKDRLKLDLQLEYDSKEAALIADYEEYVTRLKTDLEAVQHREHDLKELYVCVSQEKSQLEDNFIQEYKKKLEVEVGRLQLEYERNKSENAETRNVEIQCVLFKDNPTENELSEEANISSVGIRERLLVQVRNEVAAERAQELAAQRQELTECFETRKAQEMQGYAEKTSLEIMLAAKENSDEIGVIPESLVSNEENQLDQSGNRALHERIKAELLAEFEAEKKEEWNVREAELKKGHLEEMKELQARLDQKTFQVQKMPISPESLKEQPDKNVKSAVGAAMVEWQLHQKKKVDMEVKKQLSVEVKKQLDIEREQWEKQKTLAVEKEMKRLLAIEKLKLQESTEEEKKKLVFAAVDAAREKWFNSQENERESISKTLEAERAKMKKQQKEMLQQLMSQLQSQYWLCIQDVKNDVIKYMTESNFRFRHLVYGTDVFTAPSACIRSLFKPTANNEWKSQMLNLREIQNNMERKVAKETDHDTGSFAELSECTGSWTSSEQR